MDERRLESFIAAIPFLSLIPFSRSASSSCVYVSNMIKTCVCLSMSTRVVLNHPAAGKTLMLTLRSHVQDFLLFKVRLLHQGCTARLFHIQFREAENKLVLHVAC